MCDWNAELFSAFKRLEALCGQMYGRNGVRQYIDDMRSAGVWEFRSIDGWNQDLKMLDRVRRIRNKLAHASYLPDEWQSTERDVLWIQEFHQRILDRTDPLALLHKERQRLRAERQREEKQRKKEKRQQVRRFPVWIIPVAFGIVLLGCFLIWLFLR